MMGSTNKISVPQSNPYMARQSLLSKKNMKTNFVIKKRFKRFALKLIIILNTCKLF